MPVGGLVGAVHSRLDQLSNSLDQIGFYFSEIFVVMDKTHCGIIQQRDTTTQSQAAVLNEVSSHYRGHLHFHSCPASYPEIKSLNSLLSKLKLISLSSGILVVNVQWRGRAYVGALFDSSRQKNINQNR